jgi:hypothetical protein
MGESYQIKIKIKIKSGPSRGRLPSGKVCLVGNATGDGR